VSEHLEPAPEPSRADATRARLKQAAVQAFAQRGFHGTTTRDIATAAGMSPAALYVHHRSKEDLLYLISRSGHERTLALVRAAVASSEDPVEQLRRAAHDFAVHHARGHTSARIVNYELSALSEDHLKDILDLRRQIDREVRDLVAKGVEHGVFDTPDPRIAATAILSLGSDLPRWYRDGVAWTPEEIGDQYADLAMRIVGCTERRSGRKKAPRRKA
jgi:AcrR family transcriptional regulator